MNWSWRVHITGFCNVLLHCTTLGKLLEMFSEIASSHVTYFWFITCSVSLPVVLLLKYVFVVVLFHGIKPAHHHIFRMIMCLQWTTLFTVLYYTSTFKSLIYSDSFMQTPVYAHLHILVNEWTLIHLTILCWSWCAVLILIMYFNDSFDYFMLKLMCSVNSNYVF